MLQERQTCSRPWRRLPGLSLSCYRPTVWLLSPHRRSYICRHDLDKPPCLGSQVTTFYPTRRLILRPKPSKPQRPLPSNIRVDGSGTAGAEPIWARPSKKTMLPLWSFM